MHHRLVSDWPLPAPGSTEQCLEMVCVATVEGKGTPGIEWVKTTDAVRHPAIHRTMREVTEVMIVAKLRVLVT